MKKQNWIILMTAAGVLTTSAIAGAGGVVEKVSGMLRGDVSVTVNGESTSLHPVYINGKAYLPVRDTAEALGYELSWSGKQIELQNQEAEEDMDYVMISGVISSVTQVEDSYRLEVYGLGTNRWIILSADKDTVLTDAEGKSFQAKDLKAGMQITSEYGPIIAMSYPGQSHAATIQVGTQRSIIEQAVSAVTKTDEGWKVQFSEVKDGVETPTLTLNTGKETMVINKQGQPVDWTQIKPGTNVRAYYGPFETKSLPPQSPLFVLVVTDEQPDMETVKEYRELSWSLLSADQKSHIKTAKDEALVSIIDASHAAIMPVDDKQKEALADLVASQSKLISVTYNTDQDELLGPLTVVFNQETKEVIGYFIRK
ncbi:hypothetical protein FHS18_002314 [Paenibacillus phyllosphaerae]|uniref:Copper amine oxidase-like N-terminal domain-containing protein n=1 Tax=Paenibacillus phyllosphaerae TaxID=274593 RepID=A0A7W5FMN0_9BACL|nr:stalk domain-containing protein [Paenibacillus phyllosphaerae]MBB3110247.1 hypothetical protein [Paenibacillus phyllosphaerae]